MSEPDRAPVATRERGPHDPHADLDATRRAMAAYSGGSPPPSLASRLREFAERYGWRAYALPALVVVTVLALMTAGHANRKPAQAAAPGTGASNGASSTGSTAPPTASSNQQLKSDQAGPGALNATLPSDALPSGGAYTAQGRGAFRVLPGNGPVVGKGQLFKYTIEVENGVTGIDLTTFAKMVDTTLDDPRSWTGHGVALQRVSSGGNFAVSLTSSMTVRKLCGYSIPIETSCWAPALNRVVLNNARWVRGDPAYIGDLNAYRLYMINHEDGHALGHLHAHACLPGGLAPVMMQQTIGLKSTTGQMCQANPWPYPVGAKGAPGHEEPDTPQNSQITLQNS